MLRPHLEEDVTSSIGSERLPRGSRGWRTFVDALTRVDDTAETHWLEMKSELDLSRTGSAKIAKFILGAANRQPDVAARALEGYALMVLGVMTGAAPGISPVEDMELEKRIQPYLGADGPGWEATRVTVEGGRDVLIIIVDPPKPGDPIFVCRKDGEGVADGDVFIRARGETRRAKSGEMDLLRTRERGGAPSVDLELSVVGRVRAYTCEPAVLSDYVDSHSRDLLAKLPKPRTPTRFDGTDLAGNSLAAMVAAGMSNIDISPMMAALTIPEERSEDAYRKQVDAWGGACRRALPELIDKFVTQRAPATEFVVKNLTTRYLTDVRVDLHLAGAVEQVEADERESFVAYRYLPREPRPWGPRQRDFGVPGFTIPSSAGTTDWSGVRPAGASQATFRNGGSVDATLEMRELRPHGVETFGDEIVLVVRDASMSVVEGRWSATARDVHAVFEGACVVPVSEPLDVTDFIRASLRRD